MAAVFKLMIVLVLLIAVAGGGGAYWFYSESNELLRGEALRQLSELAPDLKFGIERAAYDLSGRACLYGLSVQLPGDVEPALYVPETLLTLDQQQMTDFTNVTVKRVRVVKPLLRVTRHGNDRWNWQGIMVRSSGGTPPLPDVEIEHGTVVVELQRDGRATRKLKLNDLHLTTHPTAARQVALVVSTRIDPAGPLNATIDLNLDGFPLTIDATWKNFPVDDGLLQLLGDVSPIIEAKLQQGRRSMAELMAKQVAAVSVPQSSMSERTPSGHSQAMRLESRVQLPPVSTPAEFGLTCVCDLTAKFHLDEAGVSPRFQVMAKLKSGQLSNALLPFPLYELGGVLYVDDREAIVRGLHAENGSARLTSLDANVVAGGTPQVELHAKGIEIDEPLKARLPESARRLLDSLALTGMCDVDVKSRVIKSQAGRDKLIWDADLKLSKGSVAHEKFPYRVRDVTGTVKLIDNVAQIEGQGTAGGSPLTLIGTVMNPGPDQDADFFIKVDRLPVDAELLAATPPVVSKVISELSLKGQGDVHFRARRPAGPGQRFKLNLDIKLRDSSCSFKDFPYAVNHLSGLVFWDGDVVRFEDLAGEHDGAVLAAAGSYQRLPAPGRLNLSIHTKNAAFDRALESAIPASLRQVWNEFQPKGRFDCDTEISWVPGQPCEVTLPNIQIKEADVQLVSFPWPLHDLKCDLAYAAPKLEVKSFSARHDDTHIHGRGTAIVRSGERWRMRFEELFVDDLVPDATFRKALPEQLRLVSETLNPTGKFSISGPVELYGPQRTADSVSAAWNAKMVLAGCAVNAGVRVEDIHGRINLQGGFDGEQTDLSGQLDLDSISVFRQPSGLSHQITRVAGPIRLQQGQLTAGARAVVLPAKGATAPSLSEQIVGEAIDGKLTLNAVVDLRTEPEYRASLTLTKGRLERYAQKYLRGQSDVAGIMNGWLNLSGRGTSAEQVQGRGKLLIAPAALYELPLFVQMFRTLRLDASDRIAFDQAAVEFNIGNSRFNFNRILLEGQAISLRGQGYVRFDGEMQLDFLSMMAQSRLRVPLLNEIANRLSRGWVGVKVTGNVGTPQTQTIPFPEFDDSMKQFLATFGATDPPPLPRKRSSSNIERPAVR